MAALPPKSKPSGRLTPDRPDGIFRSMNAKKHDPDATPGAQVEKTVHDTLLDAVEAVVARLGIASLTLDAVAAEAGMSKGGLLHHFPTKDRLVEGLVTRCAEGWRACYMQALSQTPDGPGRMARALLHHCLSDAECWTEQLRSSSSAVFAALAQNPSLIQPMRAVYSDLHHRIANDGLPTGVGEAVAAAIDGLWLDWVLGLVPVTQELVVKVRIALEGLLQSAQASPDGGLTPAAKSSLTRPSENEE
ncbi:MAG: TetR/AcrR family transcriptional regulator [Planctomycetota bacterium]